MATLDAPRAGPISFFSGYETRCAIQSIDGAAVEPSAQLLPGIHTLTVSLTHRGREYIADVDLVIPEPKSYDLKAKRKGDAFTLPIVDVDTEKTIATSTASLGGAHEIPRVCRTALANVSILFEWIDRPHPFLDRHTALQMFAPNALELFRGDL
jgi:hypothetical protein